MTPDWDGKPVTVPYASFGDPQTLNLYSYVENGPLNKVDADGHTNGPNDPTTPPYLAFGPWNCNFELNGGCTGSVLQSTGELPGSSTFEVIAGIDTSVDEQAYVDDVKATEAAAQQKGSTSERLVEGISGAANAYVAVDRAVGVVAEGLATPVTGGASGVLAAYEAVQTVSQLGAAATQLSGALSGNTKDTNKAADSMMVATSLAGVATLAVTKGNLNAASKATAAEGLVSSTVTRSIFNTVGKMVDTVMNMLTVARPASPKPPSPPPCTVAGAC